MGYKTILTVITQPGQTAQLDAAVALARREDAHLDVFCLGVDHTQTGYYYAGASAYVFQEAIDRAMASAEALETEVKAQLAPEDIRWSTESAVAQMGGVSTLIAMRARFADLVVLMRAGVTHGRIGRLGVGVEAHLRVGTARTSRRRHLRRGGRRPRRRGRLPPAVCRHRGAVPPGYGQPAAA